MATTPKPPAKTSHDQREDKRDTREDARDTKRAVTRAGEEDGEEPDNELPPEQAPPVMTVADEQRARSREIMEMGVENWKAANDERTDEEKAGNKQVPGTAPPAPETGSWTGSTRTTQAARHAQNPAASR